MRFLLIAPLYSYLKLFLVITYSFFPFYFHWRIWTMLIHIVINIPKPKIGPTAMYITTHVLEEPPTKPADSSTSSTSLANTSTFSTTSSSKNTKPAIASPSPFSSKSLEGGVTKLNSRFMDFNFGTIEMSGWHLFIFLKPSPSSLRVQASDDPTSSHGSLIFCLRVEVGWLEKIIKLN